MTMTTLINTMEAKEQFADLVNRVVHNNERIILTRRGKEIAALISLADLSTLLELQGKHDLRDAIEALNEARTQGSITLDQLKETLEN